MQGYRIIFKTATIKKSHGSDYRLEEGFGWTNTLANDINTLWREIHNNGAVITEDQIIPLHMIISIVPVFEL